MTLDSLLVYWCPGTKLISQSDYDKQQKIQILKSLISAQGNVPKDLQYSKFISK